MATKLGIMIEELGYLLEGCDDLFVKGRELCSEGYVCCGETCNGSAITGCSCGEVGNSLDHVLMIDVGVGGLETRTATSYGLDINIVKRSQ